MKKSIAKIASLLLAGVLVLGACSNNNNNDDTLVVIMPSIPAGLDPVAQNLQPASQVMVQIYETLVRQVGRDMVMSPGLATSWEFENPQTLHMELRQGVEFHNGETMTAHDVKFSLDRAINSPNVGFLFEMISEVVVNGDHSVTLLLEFPFAPILSHLAHPGASIISQSAFNSHANPDDYALSPVGTGPFMFVDHIASDRIELTVFENYWGASPNVDNITFRQIPEATSRLIEIQTGNAHIAYGISATDIASARTDDRVNLIQDPNLSLTYLGFNTQMPPFDDVRVRQAIAHALDLESIVEAVWLGIGSPALGPIADTVPGANRNLVPYEFNPQRALELLAEAGHPNGFSATLWTNTGNAQRADIVEIVQNQLRAVNIDVTVELIEFTTFTERMDTADEHQMYVLAWGTVTGDPDYGLYSLFHTSGFGPPGNRMFWSNPDVDRLLDEGRTETDWNRRVQIYAEAQEIIHANVPWISVWQGEDVSVTASGVTGFEHFPAGHHNLWTVSIGN
ncbi:MAG: ABC transporter substrate-binding protein [Defluviitaleaceae bacterium]|nr:ABC transporter substrate-binding protein [Defluviitaleaceae bacterium]